MQYAFAAHRAVVDVDVELGLVKVVELATAQDVGRAINPQAVLGQIQGGTAQGLGLAVMEEIQLENGLVRNPSFTDYLIPTILDMPPMRVDVLELADPQRALRAAGRRRAADDLVDAGDRRRHQGGHRPRLEPGPRAAGAPHGQLIGRPVAQVTLRSRQAEQPTAAESTPKASAGEAEGRVAQ